MQGDPTWNVQYAQPTREVMNISQASEYLGISHDTLYAYAGAKIVPAFKLGNRWRFRKSVLDAWMSKKENQDAG